MKTSCSPLPGGKGYHRNGWSRSCCYSLTRVCHLLRFMNIHACMRERIIFMTHHLKQSTIIDDNALCIYMCLSTWFMYVSIDICIYVCYVQLWTAILQALKTSKTLFLCVYMYLCSQYSFCNRLAAHHESHASSMYSCIDIYTHAHTRKHVCQTKSSTYGYVH